MTVYCQKCWWSDSWDAKSYGRDIDFSRPFFEQFRELLNEVPLMSMVNDDGIGSVNCEYTQNVSFAKNCYMGAMSWKNEDCYYFFEISGPEAKDIVDGLDIFQNCQTIYESIFLESCFKCRNCYYASSLVECLFCYDCHGSNNCFMSYGLRNKSYYFKNRPYSKEEYHKIIESYHLDTWSGVQRAEKEFREFIKQYPHRFAHIRNSVHCTGDALFNCKNSTYTFNARGNEDTKYFESGNVLKDCYDLCTGGETSQSYEGLTPDMDYRALFTIFTWKSQETTYCQDCHSSKHLFGCVGLKKGEYCILNKLYDKATYKALREKLIAHMKKTGEYGEFFPSHLSNFGYNETSAQFYFPLIREQAIAQGFKWQDKVQFTTGKETKTLDTVPDSIRDISDTVLDDIFACITCSRNFRIVPEELKFYRKMDIPLPRQCFFCRNQARIKFKNPYTLWHRQCDCNNGNNIYQNTTTHFHASVRCLNEFETTYSPERPEIVYCEACYQSEII
jgi:hypothetical protein